MAGSPLARLDPVARRAMAPPGRALAAVLLLGLAASVRAAEAVQLEVASVELLVPQGEDRAELEALVILRSGEPLTRRALRQTVLGFYQLGRFSNVVVRTADAGDAARVRVVVELQARRVLREVRFTQPRAERSLDEARLRKAADLTRGEEYHPARLDAAIERVRKVLQRGGYRRARVTGHGEGDRQVDVVIAIEPGPPTRVAEIVLPGVGAAISADLRTRPGALLDLDALEDDVRAIRARLRRDGYLRARVGKPAVALAGEAATVEFPVDAGPIVEFRFVGQRAFGEAELRALLALEGEQILDLPAIEAAAGRIQAHYREQGWAAALVQAAEIRADDLLIVVFGVDEGRRYRVSGSSFEGQIGHDEEWLARRLDEAFAARAESAVEAPDADAARLALAVGSPSRPRDRPRLDSREVWYPPAWDQAAAEVVDALRNDGFLGAAHDGTRVTLDARSGTAEVRIRLKEGVRTFVETVSFEGNEEVTLPDLVREAKVSPGVPLSPVAVEQTRAALLALYARRGHIYAKIQELEELSPDRRQAAVRFRIQEGPRVRVEKVLVSGNKRTRTDVVRNTLAVKPGDVYDGEAVARSQTALLRLGVFRSVGIRLQDPEVPEPSKSLAVDLAERPWQTLAPGIGYSIADGPRAFLEYTRPNLFGRALELTALAKVNYPLTAFRTESEARRLDSLAPLDRIEGRFDVGIHDRGVRLLPIPLALRIDAIGERLHRPAYDLGRGSIVLGADLEATSRVTVSLQYEIEFDRINRSSTTATLTRADVERLRFPEGHTTLQSFRPVVTVDYRDNAFYPRRGWLATAVLDYVHSIGDSGDRWLFGLVQGSDVFTHMLKLSGTVTGYMPFGRSVVLALSLRGGRVFPLEGTSKTIGPKRFFLGGAGTMRGYGEDEMVPEDVRSIYRDQVRRCASSLAGLACTDLASHVTRGETPTSEGGEAYALIKAELRVPFQGSLELGFFADLGNLWLDPANVKISALRLNIGAGLRFLTPIGPAVLDVGINVDRDQVLGERILAPHFAIGIF